MEELQREQGLLELQLADSGIYAEGRKAELRELLGRKAELDRRLVGAEEDWLVAGEELETAERHLQEE